MMTDEFTKTSFCVFIRKKMQSFAGERKKHPRVEIDRSLPEKKKKKGT